MTNTCYVFHLALSASPALSGDLFSEVGHAAWELLEKKLADWPARRAQVLDHGMQLTVDVLELCEDDVGLEPLHANPEQFTYGLAVYSEQVGLALTPEHLAAVEGMCVDAMNEAAAAAGLSSTAATLSRVEAQSRRTSWVYKTAPSLAALHQLDKEVSWVTYHGEAITGVHTKRDAAFATGASFVCSVDEAGMPVRTYWRSTAPAAESPACFTAADYTAAS